jgi:hypothetical protein
VGIRGFLASVALVGALVVVAAAAVGSSVLALRGAAVALAGAAAWVATAQTEPPAVAWCLACAFGALAAPLALPALDIDTDVGWFAYAPHPSLTDQLVGLMPGLQAYAALVAAIAALPRRRRPWLFAGTSALALVVLIAVERWSNGVAIVVLATIAVALAGAVLAGQRLPADRAKAVATALAGVGMVLLAALQLIGLAGVLSTARPAGTTVVPTLHQQAGKAVAIAIETDTVPRFPVGSGVSVAIALGGFALATWGSLRAARPVDR